MDEPNNQDRIRGYFIKKLAGQRLQQPFAKTTLIDCGAGLRVFAKQELGLIKQVQQAGGMVGAQRQRISISIIKISIGLI